MITFVLGDRCKVEGNDDIGKVADDDTSDRFGTVVVKAEIVAVIGVDNYRSFRNCNAKVSVINVFMGECNKCRARMKCTDQNVVLEMSMDRSTCTSIFDEVLNHAIEFAKVRIADSASQNTVSELLLSAQQLTYTISRKEIVASVSTC